MAHEPEVTERIPAPRPYDLAGSLSGLRMGRSDPAARVESGVVRLARRTPEGPATLEIEQEDGALVVRGWGEGAGWLASRAAELLGLADRPDEFRPTERAMREVVRRHPGVHLPRLPTVFDRVVQVVLLQLVPTIEGHGNWRRLVQRLGEPAPGPHGLILPPRPEQLAGPPSHELQRCGILPRQARVLRAVGREARRIELAASRGAAHLEATLTAIPGIGPWTVQNLLGSALARPDAVLLGDYNLPHTVAWALAGEERGTEQRMLELLEPYRGHRYRVIRLLWLHGVRAPRRGPRMALRPPMRTSR